MAQQLWLLRHGEAVPHDSKPDDERELFDFSQPSRFIDEAYALASVALDEAEAARRRRTGMRRSWWRRTG